MKAKIFILNFWILLCACMTLPSCKEDNDGFTAAIFTGIDNTRGSCGGGYYFTIDNTTYRAFHIVENSILDFKTEFPQTLWIKYEKPTDYICYDMETYLVKITAIQKPD